MEAKMGPSQSSQSGVQQRPSQRSGESDGVIRTSSPEGREEGTNDKSPRPSEDGDAIRNQTVKQSGHNHPANENNIMKTYQPHQQATGCGSLLELLAEGISGAKPSSMLPVLGWFPHFMTHQPLRSVLSDVIVGITVAAVVVPQGMAYGMLASLPPVYGLYTAILPPLVYTLFGSCMHLAVGPFALISMLTSAGIHQVVKDPENDEEACIAAAAVIALLSGCALVALGILRLGFIATFLSDSVLSGYTTAVSIIIPMSQLKYAFQLQVQRGTFLRTVEQLVVGIAEGGTNGMAFLIFALSLLTIVLLQAMNANPKNKTLKKYPIPAELTVVVLTTVIVAVLRLHERNGVLVLGPIPQGFPKMQAPDLGRFELGEMVPSVLIVSLMTYITAMSVSKTFARKFGYEVDNNQELIALGCANIVGSVSSGFPAAASLSRTAIVGSSGAATPLHNLWTVVVLVIILLFCGPLLETLPLAALAAVVVAAFKSLLLNGMAEVRMSRRVSTPDFLVWNVAFWSTLFTTVTLGIIIAVGANLLFLFYKSTRPSHAVLGRLEGSERLYRSRRLFHNAKAIEGLMLFRFDAPLHFANRDSFATQLMRNLLQHDAELNGRTVEGDTTFWGGVRELSAAIVKSTLCSDEGLRDEEAQKRRVQAVVIDMSPVAHIDISAVRAVEKLRGELAARGTRLVLAHCKFDVYEKLSNMGIFTPFEPSGSFDVVCFRELHDAVLFAEGRLEVPDMEQEEDDPGSPTLRQAKTVGAAMMHMTRQLSAGIFADEAEAPPELSATSFGGALAGASAEGLFMSARRSSRRRGTRSTAEHLEECGLCVGANDLSPHDLMRAILEEPEEPDANVVLRQSL